MGARKSRRRACQARLIACGKRSRACHGEGPQRPVGATGRSPSGVAERGACRLAAVSGQASGVSGHRIAGSGERRSKETASADSPIRPSALPPYRFTAFSPSRLPKAAPRRRTPKFLRSFAYPPIRPFALPKRRPGAARQNLGLRWLDTTLEPKRHPRAARQQWPARRFRQSGRPSMEPLCGVTARLRAVVWVRPRGPVLWSARTRPTPRARAQCEIPPFRGNTARLRWCRRAR